MTSEPRRAPPRTVEVLIDRKYNVFATLANLEFYDNSEEQINQRFVAKVLAYSALLHFLILSEDPTIKLIFI